MNGLPKGYRVDVRKFVILGFVLILGILIYFTMDMRFNSPSEAISASELSTKTATPTASPTPIRQATALPTAPPPTPTPKPTVGYIDISPTSEPEDTSLSAARHTGKEWDPMERAIMIDQNAQQIYVYEKGIKTRTIPCSTGKPIMDHFTPTWIGRVGQLKGTIFSFGVYADNAWELFKASGNILIHGAPYVYVDGKKVYQDLDSLGHYPSSHGCIRVHPADADWLTAWDMTGVPVVVTPWQGGFSE